MEFPSPASHGQKHPNYIYTISSHRRSHNVTYETARKDLQFLTTHNILDKDKKGNRFIFIAPDSIEQRLTALKK